MTGLVSGIVLSLLIVAGLAFYTVLKPAEERTDADIEFSSFETKKIAPAGALPVLKTDTAATFSVQIERPQIQQPGAASGAAGGAKSEAASSFALPDLNSRSQYLSAANSKIPSEMSMRANAQERLKALQGNGMRQQDAVKFEENIVKGLDWLVENQNPDGSWGINGTMKFTLTPLAALAIMGHGENEQSAKYGPTLSKALKMICSWFKGTSVNGSLLGDSYAFPLNAYALSEAYALTHNVQVKEAMNKAVRHIVNNMNLEGSFTYGYAKTPTVTRDPVTGRQVKGVKPEPPCDLSFAGWNYIALKTAVIAGADVPGLADAIEKASYGIRYHYNKKLDGFGQSGPTATPDLGMNCVGSLALLILGDADLKEAQEAFSSMRKTHSENIDTCSWPFNKTVYEKHARAFTYALYTWFFQTNLIYYFNKGKGAAWKKWSDSMVKAFFAEQEADGSWLSPAEKYGTQLDAQKTAAEWTKSASLKNVKDMKVYGTSFSLLILETFYRYQPLVRNLKTVAKEKDKKVIAEDEDTGLKIE